MNLFEGFNCKVLFLIEYSSGETLWSLVDICPGEVMVARGGEYTVPGKLELDFVLNRKSRYLFSIIDAGEDGMCCKYGPKGSYKVFADGVFQVGGGEFDASDTKTFGSCTEPSTFKPTNAVCLVALVCSQFFPQLTCCCHCAYLTYRLQQARLATCVPSFDSFLEFLLLLCSYLPFLSLYQPTNMPTDLPSVSYCLSSLASITDRYLFIPDVNVRTTQQVYLQTP